MLKKYLKLVSQYTSSAEMQVKLQIQQSQPWHHFSFSMDVLKSQEISVASENRVIWQDATGIIEATESLMFLN